MIPQEISDALKSAEWSRDYDAKQIAKWTNSWIESQQRVIRLTEAIEKLEEVK